MGTARPAARLLLLGLALLVCGAAGDRMVERAEVAPQPARVQTMVMVHGGRVVGVMQHVQLGRRFGPPELPPGAPDPAAECGQPQGGLSALLNWTACMVRCMRSRPTATAGQMEIVQMHLARAAAVVGATHGGPLPGATTPGFPGAAAEEQPAAMPLARPRGMPLTQRWQWDVNVPVPAEQQAPADDDQLDSAAAQQLLGTEQLPAAATAEAEPRAAPWWWPMGHARRPARGAAGGEEAAEGCHCKHCGCHHHHHGGKHHHHSHSEDGQPAPAQQLPMMMAALHDLAQQHAQQAADAQQAQRGHHGAPRHGNRDQLLPGVATPFEFIAQERAQGFTDRWTELQAAQHPAGSSMNWSLWDASGRLNWGLAAFVALAVACAGVWSAMLAQCALYRSARVNNNAAEVLAAQCYHRMASDEPEGGKGDLKPLLREGPVKGAIAAVHTKL